MIFAKKNAKKFRYFIVFINFLFVFIIISVNLIHADNILMYTENKEKNLSDEFKHRRTHIYLMFGMVYGASASDFFKDYQSLLEGKGDGFNTFPTVGGMLKLQFTNNIRFSASIDYFQVRFNDSYTSEISSDDSDIYRDVTESIRITELPIILSIEYFPYDERFKSYLGFGIGVSIKKIQWSESVYSPLPEDLRKGGELVNENSVAPVIRFTTGAELGFDKPNEKYFLGNFFIEASYTFMFNTFKMFEKLEPQFINKNFDFKKSYSIIPGIICLNFGISFNLYTASKN